MALLINSGSGDFTTTSTWNLIDSTSFLDSRAGSTTLNASGNSQAFTPGAITIRGVALQMAGRATTPNGTFTVSLLSSSVSVPGTVVTVNVADLPNTGGPTTGTPMGWTFFRYTNPVTLVAATAYQVRCETTVVNQVNVHTNGVASNFSRALVTTASAAPGVNDTIIVAGEYVTASVSNTYTVTMNNTVSSSYFGETYVANKGELRFATASNTSYWLGLRGNLHTTYSGSYRMGTLAAPIPSSSLATLEISGASAGQYNIFINPGSTFETFGQRPTSVIAAKLVANVSASNTSSLLDTDTGWLNGDIIAASNTNAATTHEIITLRSNANASALPSHSAYVNSRSGSAPTLEQSDLVNLTRNVLITSIVPANRTTMQVANSANVSSSWTGYRNMGTTTTAAISMASMTTGNFYFQYNALYQSASAIAGAAMSMGNTVNRNISNNIFYNLGASGFTGNLLNTVDNGNYIIGGISFQTFGGNIAGSNNTLANHNSHCAAGFLSGSTGNNIYQCGSGIYHILSSGLNGISNSRIWRCSIGIQSVQTFGVTRATILSFNNLYMFGNTNNINIGNSTTALAYKTVFSSSRFWGGSGVVTAAGVDVGTSAIGCGDTVYFNDCLFGVNHLDQTSSFSVACVRSNPGASVNFFNCRFVGTENAVNVTNNSFLPTNTSMGFVSFNHNQISGSYKIFTKSATLQTDTTYFVTSPESLRIIPLTTAVKAITPNIRIPVRAGNTCTVSVKVRKSTSPDAAYNGAQPRLMYVFNPVAGNLTETVGATYIDNNLLLFPQNFENAYWSNFGTTTISADADIAPDGITSADLITFPSGYNSRRRTSITIANNTTYNISIYFKNNTFTGNSMTALFTNNGSAPNDFVLLTRINFSTQTATYSLIGTAGSGISGSATGNLTALSNGWFKLEVRGTTGTAAATAAASFEITNNSLSGSAFVWGAQLYTGSVNLPYVPEGSWQTLTYTTPPVANDCVTEFYVDCDGSTGYINIDDWSTTTFNDTRGFDFSGPLGTYVEAGFRQPGGSYAFAI